MITTSDKWKEYAKYSPVYHLRGTLVDGNGVQMELNESNFMLGGFKLSDSTSDAFAFRAGTTISNTVNIVLNNTDGSFDRVNFKGARLTVFFGLFYDDDTDEWIQRGVFNLERPQTIGYTIEVVGYDDMTKLEKPFSEVDSLITYPVSHVSLINTICTSCGTSFVGTSPEILYVYQFEYDTTTTCRDVLEWMMEAQGTYARFNNMSQLEIKKYDTYYWSDEEDVWGEPPDCGVFSPWGTGDPPRKDCGSFDPWNLGNGYDGGRFLKATSVVEIDRVTESKVSIDEYQYTGAVVFYGDETHLTFGTPGYVYAQEDNPIINTHQAYVGNIFDNVRQLRVHEFDISFFGDPSIEAGDGCIIYDYLNRKYISIITNFEYSISGISKVSLGAETPEELEQYNIEFSD